MFIIEVHPWPSAKRSRNQYNASLPSVNASGLTYWLRGRGEQIHTIDSLPSSPLLPH